MVNWTQKVTVFSLQTGANLYMAYSMGDVHISMGEFSGASR